MSDALSWKKLESLTHLNAIIEESKQKPILIFKYCRSSEESIETKNGIERDWNIANDQLDCYIVEVVQNKELATAVSDLAEVSDSHPQILIFADGVTMYDETHELINVKKIKLVLKVIYRTFRWMGTRV